MAVTGQHLVGREDELEALVDLLETPERPPRTAVLCGEAGIGKTTHWLEATRPSETEAGNTFGAAVNQRYELAQGAISTQGVEGTAVRDVTGGSGAYRAARGEGRVLAINPQNATFRITFTATHPRRKQ
jgi:hypothetical protein